MAVNEKIIAGTTWAAITPSDTAKLEPVPVSVFVGTGGDVAAEGADGNVEIFKALAGTVLPIQPIRIRATGTNASNLVAVHNR